MKQKWEDGLNVIHFAPDKPLYNRTIRLIAIIIWVTIAFVVPYLYNNTYQQALYSSAVSLFALIGAVSYLKKNWPHNTKKWTYNYSGIICNMSRVFLIISMLYLLFPIMRIAPQQSGPLKENTIYVVYRQDCIYCQVANKNFNKAFVAYNAAHAKNIRIIDMNTPSQTAEEVLEYVDRIGTVVYLDDGKALTDFYTLADENQQPISPTVEHIYQVFKQFNK